MKIKRLLCSILAAAMILSTMGNFVLATETGAWDGTTIDTTWYVDSGTSYTIITAAQLAGLAKLVNEGNDFTNKTIVLDEDIDLANQEWTPIGNSTHRFLGTFDAQNHTIKNLVITGKNSEVGLFGFTANGEIKNLTVNNAKVSGYLNVGVVAGTPYTSKYTYISVTGHVEVNGFAYVGGVGGKNAYADWNNITVNVDEESYVNAVSTDENGNAYRTYVGGVVGFNGEGSHTFKNITSNINVIGDVCDIGGIFGIAHYGNNFENIKCTANVTNNVSSKNDGDDAVIDVLETGLIAGVWHNQKGCTVTFKNIYATGTIFAPNVEGVIFVNNGLIGNAYNADKNTEENSGSLIVDGENVWIKNVVAKIGETEFDTIQAALEAAKAGDEIVLLSDAAGNITVPANVIFNGNGFSVSGGIIADGNITFKGITKASDFDVNYSGTIVNIGSGASLELTGTDRLVVGHGCTFNIEGNIENAKTADISNLKPSLIMPGASFTGNGVTFNVKNAHIKATAYCSSKNSVANETFVFNIENSIWDQTNSLQFSVPTGDKDPIVNFYLKDSVINSTSHLIFGITKGEIVFDNSNVNAIENVWRQLENRSTLTIKNGSVVHASVQTSSNAKNPGTTIVDNATYKTTGEFSGSDVGTGTLIVKNGAKFSSGKITKANITIDAAGLTAGEVNMIEADLSGFAGTLAVVNNDALEAKLENGKIILVAKPVAKVGDVEYTDLQSAIQAAAPSGIVEILSDITVDKWVMFSQTKTIGNGNIITLDMNGLTINGNGHTLTVNDVESAKNGGYLFDDAANLNINDLTIDVKANAGGIHLESGTINNVTFNGGNCIFPGEGEITISECTFNTDKDDYVIYYEAPRKNLNVTNNEFNVHAEANVILLYGGETFTGNTINSGRTVNVVEGSPVVSDNTFAENVRLKVYNAATADIKNNTITYLVFEDGTAEVSSSFTDNKLTAEAFEVLKSVNGGAFKNTNEALTKENKFETLTDALISGETASISFNAFYTDFKNAEIEKYGMFIYDNSYEAGGVTLESKNSDLTASEGWFNAVVVNIPKTAFDSVIVMKPFVVIGGEPIYGDIVTATASDFIE